MQDDSSSGGARQRIVSGFVRAGAVRPEHAVAFDTADVEARRLFRRLRRHGAIVEAGAGRYWLDASRLERFRAVARWRVAALLASSGLAATITATAAVVSLVE